MNAAGAGKSSANGRLRTLWRFLYLSGVALAVSCWIQSDQLLAAQGARQFKAGAATGNITPWLGISLAGALHDRRAEHIHDELNARCLVLDDGATRLAIVVVDNTIVSQQLWREIKQLTHQRTGIPVEHMLMSATHTHSAPALVKANQMEPDQDYLRLLKVKIADGVQLAINHLAPARIGWGVGQVPEFVFNRRWKMKPGTIVHNPLGGFDQVVMHPPAGSPDLLEPAGPVDPDVSFVAVESLEGRPIALLANYSLHYVGVPAGHVSADYFGAFADHMERLLEVQRQDPPLVGILSNGTSGDVGWRNLRRTLPKADRYHWVDRIAAVVAAEVFRVHQTLEYQDWVSLDVINAELELGVRLPSPGEVERAQRIVDQTEYPLKISPGNRNQALKQYFALETTLLSQYPETLTRPLQVVRMGDLAILAIPNEVFAETGLELKQKSPFGSTFTISLAGGRSYLPPPRHHPLGGFETWRGEHSYLEVQAERKVVGKLLEMLEALKSRRSENALGN